MMSKPVTMPHGMDFRIILGLGILGALFYGFTVFQYDYFGVLKRGENGQATIQILDQMRRPLLALKQAELRLLQSAGEASAISDIESAIHDGRQKLSEYLELASYDEEVRKKVVQLEASYEAWVSLELELVRRRAFLAAGPGMWREHGELDALVHRNYSAFLTVMDLLGDGEKPIHHDINAGAAAVRGLLASSLTFIAYLIALAFWWERRRHENELRHRELAAAHAELKASQAKLLQQEKLASIGQLAAGVAHEINNPIGFVNSNLGTLSKYLGRLQEFITHQQRLLEQAANPAGQEEGALLRRQLKIDFALADGAALLQESLDGVERVRFIVQNLKDFSRVDQQRFSQADINQCLDQTLNIVAHGLKHKATLHKEYGVLPLVWCWPQQLNLVFTNLLMNAVQAIGQQGEIRIRTWAEDEDIFVTISDTGSGIAPENLGRLFDPFFTTKEVGKGTGLGLSIAYDIVVKQHGGEISATSEPGRGTTFRVRLPVGASAGEGQPKNGGALYS